MEIAQDVHKIGLCNYRYGLSEVSVRFEKTSKTYTYMSLVKKYAFSIMWTYGYDSVPYVCLLLNCVQKRCTL